MTFDDGILSIWTSANTASAGDMPTQSLSLKGSYYFAYQTVGFNRYYTAMGFGQQIDTMVAIDLDRSIHSDDIVVIDGDYSTPYRISQAQHTKDDDGLWYTRLSLTRINDEFTFNIEVEGD